MPWNLRMCQSSTRLVSFLPIPAAPRSRPAPRHKGVCETLRRNSANPYSLLAPVQASRYMALSTRTRATLPGDAEREMNRSIEAAGLGPTSTGRDEPEQQRAADKSLPEEPSPGLVQQSMRLSEATHWQGPDHVPTMGDVLHEVSAQDAEVSDAVTKPTRSITHKAQTAMSYLGSHISEALHILHDPKEAASEMAGRVMHHEYGKGYAAPTSPPAGGSQEKDKSEEHH